MNRQLCFVTIMCIMIAGNGYVLAQQNLTDAQKKLHERVEKKRQAVLNAKNASVQTRRQLMLEYADLLKLKQKNEAAMRHGN